MEAPWKADPCCKNSPYSPPREKFPICQNFENCKNYDLDSWKIGSQVRCCFGRDFDFDGSVGRE